MIRFLIQIYILINLISSSEQSKIILITDDSNSDHVQYIKYVNASAQFLSKDLKVVEMLSADSTFDNICMEVDSPETFILSLSENQKIVKDIENFSNATGIPTIQIMNKMWSYSNGTTLDRYATYVKFITPENVFNNVFQPFISGINLDNCFVLYDENYAPGRRIRTIFKSLNMKQFNFTAMQKNASAVAIQLATIKAANFQNIMLMGSMKSVEEYSSNAKQETENNYFTWFIVTMDTFPYLCDNCALTNTLWVRPDIDTTLMTLDKLQDYITEKLEHRDWIILPDQISLSFYFDLTNIALSTLTTMSNLSHAETTGNYSCATHSNFSIPTDLGNLIHQSGNRRGRFGEYQMDVNGNYFLDVNVVISNIFEDKKYRHIKTIANWSITGGMRNRYGSLTVNLTSLTNYSIVIAQAPPFIEQITENGVVKYRGYCIDLIEYLKEEQGFEYNMYVIKDNLYGSLNERGEWNGLIRDLINGHADMAVADLSVTAERENYVDFTVPYYDLVGVTILMKKEEVEYSLFKFMTVLTPPVWLCIVAAYFFTSFVMWLFDKYSPYGPKEEAKFTFTQCLWYCMTALTPQGGPEAPKNISCKLVAATWWLFGFIIIASYTANLAAFLTVSRMESSISSLDDLSQQYKIKYAPVRGTASEAYFKRMANIEQRFYDIWKAVSMNESMTPQERASLAVWDYPVSDKYTNMWRFMTANGLPNSSQEAIALVLNSQSSDEGFAYIGDATSIRYATMTDCKLTMVGGEFNRKPYAIAVQQLSPLKDLLSGTILKLSSDRKLEDLKDKWWKNNPNKLNCPEVETESSGISVKNIAGVFLVILGGIVFSIVTLIFEYFCIRNKDVSPSDGEKKEKKEKRSSSKVINVKTLNVT